jgi:hypothetical protein
MQRNHIVQLLALGLLGLAFAVPLQPVGCNQTAHLALVKSLADGSPSIDRYRTESCDTAYVDGRYYAAKAPGLALASLPGYAILDALGLNTVNPAAGAPYPRAMLELPRSAVWQVSLFGAALPAFLLLLLVRQVADRLVPGYGTAAAITVGAGTLVLPFATVYFAHVLSALLGFAAFALLLAERLGRPRLALVAGAGAAVGLATTVEHPVALLGVVLGVYALARDDRLRRGIAYGGGVALGLLPLLAYNWWALGSPFRLPYSEAVITPGRTGHDVVGANDEGFFGIGVPHPRDALELLFSARGLLVLTPVVAAGLAGIWFLYRAGRRAEALVVAGVVAVFLVYNAAYYVPFGGFVPGPRFLIPILPFLGLGIAASYRAVPLTTGLLALISVVAMTVATAAEPLLGSDDTASWVRRMGDGDFAHTIVTEAGGGHGWLAILPFLLLVALACGLAAWTLPARVQAAELPLAGIAVAAWLVLFTAGPDLLRIDRAVGQWTGAVVLALLAVAVTIAVAAVADGRVRAAAALAPLAVLLIPGFADHSKWSLLAVLAALAVLAVTVRAHHSAASTG